MRSSPAIFILPMIALISAFALGPMNPSISETLRLIFLPIAWPSYAVGKTVVNRLLPTKTDDPLSPDSPRSTDQLRQQNAALLNQVSNTQAELIALQKELARYSDLKAGIQQITRWATVIAVPSDTRNYLTISTDRLDKVRENAAVLDPRGYVGQINGISAAGKTARVLLATDTASHVLCQFYTYELLPDGKIKWLPLGIDAPVVDGTGRGLIAKQMKQKPIRDKLKVGDYALLDDPKLSISPALQGFIVGKVTRIKLPATESGLADVELSPVVDFAALREVMVVTK